MIENEQEFSFKNFFVPLTTLKAIHIIVIVGLIVYANMFFNDFVWDDIKQIAASPLVHSFSYIPTIFTMGQVNVFYRPIFLSYLTIVYTLFHGNVFFFHLLQVIMHILNTILVFILFKKLVKQSIAFIVSLIFLVHPMNVETVAYMSAVSDVLVFLFGIFALWIVSVGNSQRYSFVLAGFLILLSILTKESGILWLCIVLTYLLLFKTIKQIGTAILVIFPLGVYAFMRLFIGHTGTGITNHIPIANLTFTQRLITIPKIVFFYFYTFFYPDKLAVSQHWVVKTPSVRHFVFPLLFDMMLVIFLVGVGYYLYRLRHPEFRKYIFFLIWFAVSLIMYLQLFPLDMTVAERWFYIPIVGLLGMLAVVVEIVKLKSSLRFLAVVVVVLIIISLSIRTMVRNTNWANALTLFSHDVRANTDSYDVQSNLATALVEAGKLDEAIDHARKATKLEPDNTSGWATLGTIYMQKKDLPKGIMYLRKSLDYDGGNYSALYNLTYGELKVNDYPSAKSYADWGLKTYPADSMLKLFRAVAEYNLGDQQLALQDAYEANQGLQNQTSQYIYNQIINKQQINLE